jgi:hypothetical protein
MDGAGITRSGGFLPIPPTTTRMPFQRLPHHFQGFHDLVAHRVREILLVSTLYDAFVLEEDRDLSERLFEEYVDLDLRFVPRITRVSTGGEALSAMRRQPFGLVLCMSRLPDMTAMQFRRLTRAEHPNLPIAFLTYDALDLELHASLIGEGGLDRVYYWLRDTKILLSIVKQVEDARNAPEDTQRGVQVILLVEDSPRFYSSLLPLLYTEVYTQTRSLIADSTNVYDRLLRMRARPKILLAQTWESACETFDRFQLNVIGVISDLRFPKGSVTDSDAGLSFARRAKTLVPDLPVLIQSSEPDLATRVQSEGFGYACKESPTLSWEIRTFVRDNFGFGDFVFRSLEGVSDLRASNLQELYEGIRDAPDEVLAYHAGRNHFSIWLRARTEFELAEQMRPKKASDFSSLAEMREDLLRVIDRRLRPQKDGTVREFSPKRLASTNNFIRIGAGSLGGKARGLAFINALLARSELSSEHAHLAVRIPNTFVLCTDAFEEFVQDNDLWSLAQTESADDVVSKAFLAGRFPGHLEEDLAALLEQIHYPLAIRSSSLLEDNQALPFAGLYRTYMLPNNHSSLDVRLQQLVLAVKLVWASIWYRGPKEYIRSTGYRIDEERMGVVIQQIVGSSHQDAHYPTLSGVARSYSFYPFPGMKPHDGTASLALGLGKAIVDNERVYHFCPAWPSVDPPYGSAQEFAENGQSDFYAVDISRPDVDVCADESFSLLRLPLARAEADGVLGHVGSTYFPDDSVIRDHVMLPGQRIVRFASILKQDSFPLADLLKELLEVGQDAFGSPVEIEFAMEISPSGMEAEFHFLQIRPMVLDERAMEVDLDGVDPQSTLCTSVSSLGNGRYTDLFDIVFVDPSAWDPLRTQQMALELERLDAMLASEGRHYMLIGFGRWATSDPSLGVPVRWDQVSHARVFVESDRPDLWVEPSQGSHFFQNMLALRLGYLFVKQSDPRSFLNWSWLTRQTVFQSTKHLRHLRFDHPVVVEVDGRSSKGVIRLPP